MDKNFNEMGQQSKFIFHTGNEAQTYEISMFKDYKGPAGLYEVIGSYEVVDDSESQELTEKTMANLMRVLDGKSPLENLSDSVDTRLLYEMVPRVNDVDPTVINFRTYDGNGVSKENAILKLERGVYHERIN